MKCNRKTLLLQFPCKKKKRSWREHYTHAYTYVWVGCQKVQEGNFGRRRFFSHLSLEEGVASKRALRSISFIFIIILKIHLTNSSKSHHIYIQIAPDVCTWVIRWLKTILWTYCYVIRLNYLIPNYFLCFFADFFFSSRTSFWTRFNIGCAHIVRSIMLFAGWATRFLTLDFLTLDFLGAIFFWYFSLRKKIKNTRTTRR